MPHDFGSGSRWLLGASLGSNGFSLGGHGMAPWCFRIS